MGVLSQFDALFIKNLQFFYRKRFGSIALLLVPLICFSVFYIVENEQNIVEHAAPLDFIEGSKPLSCDVYDMDGHKMNGFPCVIMAYAPQSNTELTDIMKIVATQNNLKFGEDIVGYDSDDDIARFIFNNIGSLKSYILLNEENTNVKEFDYSIWTNRTNVDSYIPLTDTFHYQRIVDQAYVAYKSGKPDAKMTIDFKSFPTTYDQVISQTVMPKLTPVLASSTVIVACSIWTLIIIAFVTHEKRHKLLNLMRVVGLNESSYWWSWYVFVFLFALITGLTTAIFTTSVHDDKLFYSIDFSVSVLLFVGAFWCYGALGMFVSSFITKHRWINAAGFTILVIGCAINGYYSVENAGNLDSFDDDGHYVTAWATGHHDGSLLVNSLQFMLPSFQIGQSMSTIVMKTGFRGREKYWPLSTFSFDDMSTKLSFEIAGSMNDETWSPSTVEANIINMYLSSIIYCFLAWYCGQVFASAGKKKFYFPFTKTYWFPHAGSDSSLGNDTLSKIQAKSTEEKSVILHKLTKSFAKNTAVKEMSFEMKNGEIFCLLGHNGAGKSTTINVLTGQHAPTFGDAYIMGNSVSSEMYKIQKLMGLCPQFDILFNEISAKAHIRFWARFKGVPLKDLSNEVTKSLKAVNLYNVKDRIAGSFSGGMMRRLSVAISAVGDARILFLDEPTTGMDPLSRRQVWDAIKSWKKDRVIILTTHSMEEADMLGDEIAIMSQGRLRAIGSSLFLKNRFGSGHQVNMLTDPDNARKLEVMSRKLLPGSEVVANAAGAISLALPPSCLPCLPDFFRELEKPSTGVSEWGLSNTTLEQVFIKLTQQNKSVDAEGDGKEKTVFCRLCGIREADDVTLYTKDLKPVSISGFVCKSCALGEDHDLVDVLLKASPNSLSVSPSAPDYNENMPKNNNNNNSTTATDHIDDSIVDNDQLLGDNEPGHAVDISSPTNDINRKLVGKNGNTKKHNYTKSYHPTMWSMLSALARKNALLLMYRKKTLIVKLVLVVIAMIMMTILAEEENRVLPYEIDGDLYCPQGFTVRTYKMRQCDEDRFVSNWDDGDLNYGFYTNNERCYSSTNGTEPKRKAYSRYDLRTRGYGYSIFDNYDTYYGDYNDMHIWIENKSKDDISTFEFDSTASCPESGQKTTIVDKTGTHMIASFLQAQIDIKNNSKDISDVCPYNSDDYRSLRWNLFTTIEEANNFYDDSFPDMAFEINKLDMSSGELDIVVYSYLVKPSEGRTYISWSSLAYPDVQVASIGKRYNDDEVCGTIYSPTIDTNPDSDYESDTYMMNMYSYVQFAFVRNVLNDPEYSIKTTPLRRLTIKPYRQYAPDHIQAYALFPLISLLFFPELVDMLVYEKRNRQFHLMKMQGLSDMAYNLANYIIYGAISLSFMLFAILVGKVVNVSSFTIGDPFEFFITSLIWAHSVVGIAYLLSAILLRTRLATPVAYFCVILMVGGCTAIGKDVLWNNFFKLSPIGVFARTLSVVMKEPGIHDNIFELWCLMFITGSGVFLLGVYLHAVIPIRAGQAEHPLFFLKWLISKSKKNADMKLKNLNGISFDPLVNDEREFVAKTKDLPIRLLDVQKTYPGKNGEPPKHAVNGVSFGVSIGECLGLLGPNGAGKTTTLDMLSGTIPVTNGSATISGYDVRTEMSNIHGVLGVCPQFDTVWPNLSTEEHLRLFAKLKGAPKKDIKTIVQQALEDIELDGDSRGMAASTLSGGMQRRLSIGIALIGDPKVIFLDEPTTGLDPETRQKVWEIINNAKPGRSIILTTHSMEEADALSNRIAIMANGSLRCIGSQQLLKNRFGDGYQLKIMLDEHSTTSKTIEFIRSFASAAKCVYSFGLARTFVIPRQSITMSSIFESMTHGSKNAGIKEWAIQQTSLEEVFVKIAREAESSS